MSGKETKSCSKTFERCVKVDKASISASLFTEDAVVDLLVVEGHLSLHRWGFSSFLLCLSPLYVDVGRILCHGREAQMGTMVPAEISCQVKSYHVLRLVSVRSLGPVQKGIPVLYICTLSDSRQALLEAK